jgi:hypothetical protein
MNEALSKAIESMNEAIHVIEALKPKENGMGTIVRLRAALSALSSAETAEPIQFLCNATRFRLNFNGQKNCTSLVNFADSLQGQWVALVPAENDRHMKMVAAPQQAAQPAPMPVAWMHDVPGRVDVIHNEVKELWLKVGQPSGFYREKVPCKVERYTIPLYAAIPLPAQQVAEQKDAATPNYRTFGIDVLKLSRDHGCADVDGSDMQELAAKHGLIVEREVTERCGESCECAEIGEIPGKCFFYAEDAIAAMTAGGQEK